MSTREKSRDEKKNSKISFLSMKRLINLGNREAMCWIFPRSPMGCTKHFNFQPKGGRGQRVVLTYDGAHRGDVGGLGGMSGRAMHRMTELL